MTDTSLALRDRRCLLSFFTMRWPLSTLSDRFPWLNGRRLVIGVLGTALLIVFVVPNADLVVQFLKVVSFVGIAAAVLCVLTFSAKARVRMARFLNTKNLRFRYKSVRRGSAVASLVALSFFLVQSVSFSLWSSSEQRADGRQPPRPATSSAMAEPTSRASIAQASYDAELEEARRFICAFSQYSESTGVPTTDEDLSNLALAAAGHVQEFFHVSHAEASEVANDIERARRGGEINCSEVLKRSPLKAAAPTYRSGDSREAVRAAVIFCSEFRPMLKPGETVIDAETMVSPSPCRIGPGDVLMWCPNGTRIGPSVTIAEKLKIPWQQANADIMAGLERFDPKRPIAEACAELDKENPAESGALERQHKST